MKSINSSLRLAVGTLALVSANVLAAVTAEQAAAAPEDIALNRTFAQEQLAEGNLELALEGIERVIIASPLDLAARFFRINIMVLLNRGGEVVDELETILTLSLPEADLQRARDLLVRIEKANAKLNMQVRFKAGIEYIDNANGWTDFRATADDGLSARVDNVNQADIPDEDHKQLDDFAWVTSVSAGGTYALNEQKTSALKFSGSAQSKEYVDTLNKQGTTVSGSLALQQKYDSTTVEFGKSLAILNRNNFANSGERVNTDSDVNTHYLNLNQRYESVTLNYRFSQTSLKNDGFGDPEAAKRYDMTTDSHALTLLRPVKRGLLVQGGLSYAEARNENQADGDIRAGTDADTITVSGAAFQTLQNGDSVVTRVSYADSNGLHELSTKPRSKDTETLSVSLEYRADMSKLVPGLVGWTIGAGIKSVMVESNLVDFEKDTNTANVFVERKWDIWK